MKCLIIDDSEFNHILLGAFLQHLGVDPLAAFHGRRGLEAAVREMPDLIVIDIPDTEALEVVRVLQENEDTRSIPLLAIGSWDPSGQQRRATFEAGCVECLSKPVSIDDLRAAVLRYGRSRQGG